MAKVQIPIDIGANNITFQDTGPLPNLVTLQYVDTFTQTRYSKRDIETRTSLLALLKFPFLSDT